MVAIVTGNGLGLERSSAWVLGSRGQVGSSGLGRDNEDLYVNAATGNLVIHGNDEILTGRFVTSTVGHTYNSLSAGGYDNPDNWMPDVARRIIGSNGDATITRIDWDGSDEVFVKQSNGQYLFKDGLGADDTITFASNVWTWTDGDTQTTELYDSNNGGRLTNVYSPMNSGLTYHYSASYAAGGKVDKITTIDSEYVEFTWSGNNLTQLVTQTTGPTATTTRVSYGYDGYNRLTSVTTDLSPGDNTVSDNNVYTISYTYDDTGVTAGTGKRLASIAQQDGSLIQFTYALVRGDYRVSSYTQTIAAGVTRTTSFDYTLTDRTTVTDPANQKTILYYDSNNRLTQISYPLENGNTTPRVVQFAYDSNGNVVTARLGPGNIVAYEYDSHDNRIVERDSAGNTVARTYGTRNQLLAEARYLEPDQDGAGSGSPSGALVTHYAYDASLRMTFAVSATGRVTEYRYNDAGLRSAEIDYAADIYGGSDFSDSALGTWAGARDKTTTLRTDTVYDPRGNIYFVTSYSVVDSSGSGVTTADYSRTFYSYDYGGRLLSRHTNADAASEVFVYDGLGRLTQSTDFGGNVTKTYFLDARGQTVLTHANGLSEVSTYDRAGELVAHSESTAGGNLVDLGGWPGNPGNVPSGTATVTNWQNPAGFVDETHWEATTGPDGLPVVAMRSGQTDTSTAWGGGNTTNNVTIDPNQAYEFTYYFKFSNLDKHYAFFGVSSTSPATVDNLATGADDSSGYFFYAYPDNNMESSNFTAGKWYKVVGYVLPQTTATSNAKLGGVYDVETGQKVLDNYATFRWNYNNGNPPNSVYARFCNYYGQTQQLDSTYFYQPEIRQVSIPTALGPDSTTSLYRYDNLGRLRMTVDPTGRRNYIMYDSVGRKVADIDADGSVIEYRYDGNDHLTSTTRYATRLSSSQLASLVDANGNPTSATYGAQVDANGAAISAAASLRPAASADDQWTFQVYDAAQRLIQTIDGTGATSVYTYDGASRLISTKAYANRLSSTVIANLKAEASNPNLWANPGNAALWSTSNLTVAEVSVSPKTYIEGVEAFKFTVTNTNQYEAFASGSFTGKTGDSLSYTISIEGVSSLTVDVTGIFASSSSWGASPDSYATIVSGPGAISQWTGGLFTVSGLATNQATRITISRKLLQDESPAVLFYVRSLDYSLAGSGDSVIVAAPVFTRTHSATLNLPNDDSAHDRVSRTFYDADDRVIGTLDGEGYLTETRYDGAGRKTQTIAYSGVTSTTYQASGSFSQLLGSITADNAKDIHNYFVYDPRGYLRATVDGEGVLTRYHYRVDGEIDEVRSGQQLDPAALISTPPTLANLPSEPSGAIVSVTSYTRDLYGRPTDVAVTLTGSTTTTTHYAYDAMGRLVSTITQYGGSDARATTRRYDLRGRLVGELDAIGYASLPGSPTQVQIDAAYAAHGVTYAYDAAGRLTSSIDASGRKTLHYYDTDGLLAYQIDPLGEVVEYRYDALGRRTDTIVYAARLGSLTGLAGGNVTASLVSAVAAIAGSAIDDATHIDFNVDGTVKQSTDQLGNVTAYSYNGFGETEAIVAPLDSRTIETDTFYDRRGLLKTHIVDPGTGTHLALTTSYGYDAFGRALTLTDALNKVTATTYDRDGRVKTVTDALGNVTTDTWDSRGNLVAVTDALNKVTRFVYDKANRRIATIDARGGVVTSSYDPDGRVTGTRAYVNAMSLGALPLEVTESALSLPSTSTSDQVTRFIYDKDGQLRFTIDALMHVVENRYDAVGNVIRTIAYDGAISAPAGYTESDLASAVASLASAAGTRITRAIYDAADRLSYAINAVGEVTSYVYDSEGRLIRKAEFAAHYTGADTVDPSFATMGSSFGSPGSNDRVTRAYYDRKGQLNFSVDALGYVTRMDYDKQGNVTRQTRYADTYSASDSTTLANLVSNFASPPSTRRETAFAYDAAGRLQQTTDPENHVTRLTLDAMGRIVSSAEAYGTSDESVTAFSYDDAGRTASVTRGYGTAAASTSWFFYDGVGRQKARVDGDRYLTVWGYDDGGNCTSETHYAGAIAGSVAIAATTSVATLIGSAGTVDVATSTHYDALNRVDAATDARGSVASRHYDALGEVQDETEQMESGTGDDRTTQWSYDSFGDAVAVTDPRGNQTISFYDKLGRVIRVSDPYQYFTDTTYSRGGQIASIKKWANAKTGITVTASAFPADPTADAAHDAVTVFTYDKRDALTAVTDAENYTESYTLNAFGERTDVRNKLYVSGTFDTNVHYTYDKNGLVLTETLPVTTRTTGNVAINVENHYSYDGRGNRTQMIEAYGAAEVRTTHYDYDKLDRLTTTTHDAVSIVNDDLTATTGVTPTEQLKYDRRGNVIEKIDAGGARTLAWYDDLGRAVAQVVQSGKDSISGADKGTLTRTTYDGNGNVATVKVFGDLISLPADATGSIPSPENSTNYRLTTFGYDRSDRLKTTTVAGLRTGEFASGTWSFSTTDIVTTRDYDMAGNVIREEDGRLNHVYTWYDKLNRKTAQVDAENYLTTWTYDAEGNVSSETRFATPLTSFTVPSASAVTTPPSGGTSTDNRTTTFGYDRNGRRTSEVRSGVAYTWVDATTGVGTDASGSSTITYAYNGLGQVTGKTQVLDAHSTPVTDVVSYDYDRIGRLVQETDPSFTDWTGATVTPRTLFTYDGLGNVVTQRLQAGASANDTNDRITTYAYGAGGRLDAMTVTVTASTSFTHNYGYDKAGRVVRDSYTRTRSDNSTTVTEAQVTRYDLAGRAVVQTFARLSGSTWVFTDDTTSANPYDAVRIRYNAYGDVDGRGLTAGPAATAVYQETFDYDAGGRLWRSTAGDGVLRFYAYDRAGNQTLTLASTGADLSALTLANYTGSIDSSGDTTTTDAVATVAVFDKRGMQIQTREPDRRLTASATALIVHGKTYNAFGEVASETDPRGFDASGNAITFSGGAGYTTTYAYNAMGRLVAKAAPQVSVTAESGAVSSANPTQYYGYDLSGRLVSATDANSHRTTRLLLSGTGHEASGEPLVTAEFHPDGGVARTFYDVFGDARLVRSELATSATATYNSATDEQLGYDKMSRLVTDVHRGALLTDTYVYDGLGQRTRHTNDLLGGSNVERTDYDAQGRVVAQIAFGGDTTSTSYAWTSTLSNSGLGTSGGWTTVTTYANSKTLTEQSDMFDHLLAKTDLGGNAFTYAYDKGARMVSQAISGETLTYSWFNTGRTSSISNGSGNSTVYGYDAAGNETSEWTQKASVVVQNASAQYDALNRMTSWTEAGNGTLNTGSPPASISYEYDANGNIRRSNASYRWLDLNGTAESSSTAQDYWYAYDSMNRVVIEKGGLSGGHVVVGTGVGIGYSYDKAGQRHSSTRIKDASYTFIVNESTGETLTRHHDINNSETYVYAADGTMTEVDIAQDTFAEGNYTVGTAQLKSSYSYDAMQRQTRQIDWLLDGTNAAYDRQVVYNAKGQVDTETVYSKQGLDLYENITTNQYGSGTSYALGSVTSSAVDTYKYVNNAYSDSAVPDNTTTNTYTWWDGAVQSTIAYKPDATGSTTWTTTFSYGPSGQLASATIDDERDRTVTFTNDMAGQVLRRDEADGNTTGSYAGDPHEVWYRFGGKQVGYTGNNGTLDTDYLGSIDNRVRTPLNAKHSSAFQFGDTTPTPYADFDQSVDPINSYGHGGGGGSYTARAGDTLQSVALMLFGDQSLWYKLAEANGLSAGSALIEGQSLNIPSGVLASGHSASTFKPYDAARALGDLSPTTPKPSKQHGCATIGLILMVAIAVAVTVVSSGAALAALCPSIGGISAGITALGTGLTAVGGTAIGAGTMIAAGAIGGALGSIASQAFGVATGLQDKFSWKGVAMGAISGAISGGLGRLSGVANAANAADAAGSATAGAAGAASVARLGRIGAFLARGGLTSGAVRGALASALSQGIGVATRLQDKFSWSGVAGAALAGGISGGLSKAGFGNIDWSHPTARALGAATAVSTAGAMANAAARSIIDGTDFGDNVRAALPDIIGSTVGNLFAGHLIGRASNRPVLTPQSISVFDDAGTFSGTSSSTQDVLQQLPDVGGRSPGGGTATILSSRVSSSGTNGGSSGAGGVDGVVEKSGTITVVTRSDANWRNTYEDLRLDPMRHDSIPQLFGDYYLTSPENIERVRDEFVHDYGGDNEALSRVIEDFHGFGRGGKYAGPSEAFATALQSVVARDQAAQRQVVSSLFGDSSDRFQLDPIARDGLNRWRGLEYSPQAFYFQDNVNGQISVPRLSTRERAWAFGRAALHGVFSVLSGAGAAGSTELCVTGVGCVVPIALGASAVTEGDNFITAFREGWSGLPQDTLGTMGISALTGVSREQADVDYGRFQLATGIAGGVSGVRVLLTRGSALAAETGAPGTIGHLLGDYHPDSFIHITPGAPEDFAAGINEGTYFSRLGDVSHLTPEEFRTTVVGAHAPGYYPNAQLFVVVGREASGSFRGLPPEAVNLSGTTEYVNGERLMASGFVRAH